MGNRTRALQFLDLFREHLVGAQFTYKVHGTEIITTQAVLLGELACREDPQPGEVGVILGLHQSTISRSLARLVELKMLRARHDPHDGRKKLYEITPKGHEFVSFLWGERHKIIARRLAELSKSEQQSVTVFMRAFLGQEIVARMSLIRGEPEIGTVFRGLTYDHGVVSGDYLESGFSVTDWLILSEVQYNRRTPGDLARLMQASKSTVALRLRSLEQRKLLRSELNAHDRRERVLSLTDAGVRALESIERCAERKFSARLAQIDPVRQEQGLELFARYVHALNKSAILMTQVTRVPLEDLKELRVEALDWIRQQPGRYPMSGYLLHSKNFVARVCMNEKLVAVIECELLGKGGASLVNFILPRREVSPFTADQVRSMAEAHLNVALSLNEEWSHYLRSIRAK